MYRYIPDRFASENNSTTFTINYLKHKSVVYILYMFIYFISKKKCFKHFHHTCQLNRMSLFYANNFRVISKYSIKVRLREQLDPARWLSRCRGALLIQQMALQSLIATGTHGTALRWVLGAVQGRAGGGVGEVEGRVWRYCVFVHGR